MTRATEMSDPDEQLLDEVREVLRRRGGGPPLPAGATAGPYRIIRRLGAGGMGVVYEAQRPGSTRRVALKVLRPSTRSTQSHRRFEHEIEVIKRLDHPGIAAFFEAGTLAEGDQPYFAMELVDGLPLGDAVERLGLDLRARLQLLATICDAVHHAHARGVIHRDLKPSNILLDQAGRPRVLDFGVARLTDSDIRATTLRTDIGQLIGTLPYMSPEQAAGNPGRLDTRSDVYALGVIAYELITGRLPHDLDGRSIPDALRAILNDPPRRARSVIRSLPSDLETILDTALDKDPARRYQSAAALADDLRRHLAHQPITAQPPTLTYQLRSMIARHRTLSAAVVSIALLLAVASVAMSFLYARAERSRVRAERAEQAAESRADAAQAASASLTSLMRRLTSMDQMSDSPVRGGDEEPFTREVLDRTTETLDVLLTDQPAARADMLTMASGLYARRGIADRAVELAERGLALNRDARAPLDPITLDALHQLGDARIALGEPAALAQQRAELEGVLDETIDDRARGRLSSQLGRILERAGDPADAAARFDAAADAFGRAFGADHRLVGVQRALAARCLGEAGRTEEALSQLIAIDAQQQSAGELLAAATTQATMVTVLRSARRLDEAVECARTAEQLARRARGINDPVRLQRLEGLANVVMEHGDLAAAEQLYRRLLERRVETLPPGALHIARSQDMLGNCLSCRGDLAAATELYTQALEAFRGLRPDGDPVVMGMLYELARTFDPSDAAAAAVRRAEATAYRQLADTLPPEHVYQSESRLVMGTVELREGHLDAAERELSECVTFSRRNLDADNWVRAYYETVYGQCLARLGRFSEAEPLMLDAWSIIADQFGPGFQRRLDAHRRIIELYELWGRPDEAASWRAALPAGAGPLSW